MMLSFLIENQALEWQDLSEQDGIFSQFCGPERRHINQFEVLDSKGDGIQNTEYMKRGPDSKDNSSKTTLFKKRSLQLKQKNVICSLKEAWVK